MEASCKRKCRLILAPALLPGKKRVRDLGNLVSWQGDVTLRVLLDIKIER